MAYCRKCGQEIDDEAVVCPHCGVQQKPMQHDDGSVVWFILGFLIPLVGLILWAAWHSEKPNSAKMAGYGFLANLVLSAVIIQAVIIAGIQIL